MGKSPPNLENLVFRRAKTVEKNLSAGQLTGPWTIGQLLLLKKKQVTDEKYL